MTNPTHLTIYNPANGNQITTLPITTPTEIQEKFQKLQIGQKIWGAKKPEERLAIIQSFGVLVQSHIDELAKTLTQETGKPITQSYNEIRGAHNRIDHLTKEGLSWLSEEIMITDPLTEKIVYEALGVVANISAWNFPYNVGYNVFLYALFAGNAVMYKPSEFATLTGQKITNLLYEAGVPENVFQCIIGGGATGQALLDLPLDGYFFTGSHATGQKIAQVIAPRLVPLQLELGGKDPLYVMDDIQDIKQAAINAAEGAFYNAGQSCCAVERIYVHEKIYPEFLHYFIDEVRSYVIGDPMDPSTFIGPLTRKAQRQVLLNQIEDAISKGGILEAGGKIPQNNGHYFEPTVISHAHHEMTLMQEESFGPIIGLQRVRSDEEAMKWMQDTPYGLTAAVFSQDKERALQVLAQMNTGTVYWNCCDRVSPNLPWSGRKNSGLGSTLSHQGIRAFVQPKAYHLRG